MLLFASGQHLHTIRVNERFTFVCKIDFFFLFFGLASPLFFPSLADVAVVLERLWAAQLPQEVAGITGIRGGEFLAVTGGMIG